MGTFNLRFFGRFVFAEPVTKADQGTGELKVLAVNMQYNNDVASDGHGFVMTTERTQVSVPGTRRPDVMLMGSTAPATSELCMWDLRDRQVTVEGDGTFTWYRKKDGATDAGKHGNEALADLRELTSGQGRFDKLNLSTKGLFSPVHGLVNIRSGVGITSQMAPGEMTTFVKFTHEDSGLGEFKLADVVEIRIDQGAKNTLTVHLENRSGGPAGAIVLTAGPDRDEKGDFLTTIVNFSNLCSTPHREFDHEFAAFYEVLEQPALLRERLIPAQAPELGWEFDCFKPSYIPYRVG